MDSGVGGLACSDAARRDLPPCRPALRRAERAGGLGRVLDVLETGRIGRPLVAPEIGVARAGGDHQQIVRDRVAVHVDLPARAVHAGHLAEPDPNVRLPPPEAADRPGDVGRRQAGGGGLIERRLEEMMVAPVEPPARFCATAVPEISIRPSRTSSIRIALSARHKALMPQ
jgi:hypothetical protein